MNLYEWRLARVWLRRSGICFVDGVREKSFADFSLAPMMLNSNDLDTVVLGVGSSRFLAQGWI